MNIYKKKIYELIIIQIFNIVIWYMIGIFISDIYIMKMGLCIKKDILLKILQVVYFL